MGQGRPPDWITARCLGGTALNRYQLGGSRVPAGIVGPLATVVRPRRSVLQLRDRSCRQLAVLDSRRTESARTARLVAKPGLCWVGLPAPRETAPPLHPGVFHGREPSAARLQKKARSPPIEPDIHWAVSVTNRIEPRRTVSPHGPSTGGKAPGRAPLPVRGETPACREYGSHGNRRLVADPVPDCGSQGGPFNHGHPS